MRETFGTTWTFQLIIVFILIFSCFLSLVISYSKAYSLKNESLTIIEKYEGLTTESGEIMNNYLRENGYRTTGKCPEGWLGAVDLDGTYEKVKDSTRYYYCLTEESEKDKIHYNIRLFYKFNLPVIGDITTFKIEGTTNDFIGNNNRITKGVS